VTVAHRHDPKLLDTYSRILLDRGVEDLITVDTSINHLLPLPTVAIAGHPRIESVTNIVLNHRRAARLALNHLVKLGHREIAFRKGSHFSSDSEEHWNAIREVAGELGIRMLTELIVKLEGDDPTTQLGYQFGKKLPARGRPSTALFAYTDISAIGSIHAFQEAVTSS
jgi:DNA-binding LacI/PurR family transcriptional regulator